MREDPCRNVDALLGCRLPDERGHTTRSNQGLVELCKIVAGYDNRNATRLLILHSGRVVRKVHQFAENCLTIYCVLDLVPPVAQPSIDIVDQNRGHSCFAHSQHPSSVQIGTAQQLSWLQSLL